ncbi:hypothetical protein OS190_04330 [Sulfitobacter sp. F26204]|uniref:hypothetical protein n=1 Tax=Sulfitobacter sp. F26204 TaxID=2996014 RepID=UPI00225E68B1|nr:hypothetical protein [Sulfitobacter sp. F26204]MCX7558782.1 hypothetical protein [Sulfitobacter sp. F26204]
MTADEISWAPSRRVFLRRVAISTAITFVGLAAVGLAFAVYFNLSTAWAFLISATLTLGFVVEDMMRWRNLRTDIWQISEGQFIHDGPDGRSQLPLSEIVSAKPQLGSRVVIKLASGQRMLMRYLPYAAATAAQIEEARGPLPR